MKLLQDLARHTRQCHATGEPIRPGEEYFSALVETPVGSERRDYSLAGWTGPPEGVIGFWKGRLPEETVSNAPKQASVETMLDWFDRFAQNSDPLDERDTQRRYMLTLLLVRKRALKLHSVRSDEDKSYLVVRRGPKEPVIEVLDPGLDENELEKLETDLHDWLIDHANEADGAVG